MLLTEQKLEFVVCSVAAATWPAARVREEASSPQSSPCRRLQHVTSDPGPDSSPKRALAKLVKSLLGLPVRNWLFILQLGQRQWQSLSVTFDKFARLFQLLHKKFWFRSRTIRSFVFIGQISWQCPPSL